MCKESYYISGLVKDDKVSGATSREADGSVQWGSLRAETYGHSIQRAEGEELLKQRATGN